MFGVTMKPNSFFNLNPETILDAIDAIGFKTTGRCLPLNSIENRVYEVEIDRPESEINSVSDQFIVTKFYRPGRWSKEQILEEHEFMLDLVEAEVPVIPPIMVNGETFLNLKGLIYFIAFMKSGEGEPGRDE